MCCGGSFLPSLLFRMKDVSSEAERYKVYDSSLKFMMNIKTDLTNIGKNYTVSDKDNQ